MILLFPLLLLGLMILISPFIPSMFYHPHNLKINIIAGFTGSGKTTTLAWIKYMADKKKIPVYSTVYIEGAFMIEPSEIYKYRTENCIIIVDEGSNVWDNRNWKAFPERHKRFFQMHRHEGASVWIATQDWEDIDAKIKRLVHNIYIMKRTLLPKYIKLKKIVCDIDISEDGKEIAKTFKYQFPLLGGVKYLFAPTVWKYFNSWFRDVLPVKPIWIEWNKENQDKFTIDYTKQDSIKIIK